MPKHNTPSRDESLKKLLAELNGAAERAGDLVSKMGPKVALVLEILLKNAYQKTHLLDVRQHAENGANIKPEKGGPGSRFKP